MYCSSDSQYIETNDCLSLSLSLVRAIFPPSFFRSFLEEYIHTDYHSLGKFIFFVLYLFFTRFASICLSSSSSFSHSIFSTPAYLLSFVRSIGKKQLEGRKYDDTSENKISHMIK
jgi:hypothetical protein